MKPILSVVTTSRNDNHGGDLNRRTNLFIQALAQQCNRHNLPAELVLVEWNPPEERQSLADELAWNEAGGMLEVRIITVPREVHKRYKYADRQALYQMIGKNVGIRRSQGEYILATNVDILFSEELIAYLASGKLQRGFEYRVDRFDVDMPLPDQNGVDSIKLLAEFNRNLLRHNRREGTLNLRTGAYSKIYRDDFADGRERLHTNACGDFAMTHRDHWFETKGYPELDLFSFHIDSIWCFQAHFTRIVEKFLAPPLAIYHIEHHEGFTPETLKVMDNALQKKKLPRLSDSHLNAFAVRMTQSRAPIRFNDEEWGLANDNLPELTRVKARWSLEASNFRNNSVSVKAAQ